MILVTTKAFRARIAEFATRAESETIYITRPGGRMLMLSSVPEGDRKHLRQLKLAKETDINDNTK